MKENERYLQSVVKLIKLTNDQKLRWRRVGPSSAFEGVSDFEGHRLRFTYSPLVPRNVAAWLTPSPPPEFTKCTLAVYGASEQVAFEYSQLSALSGQHSAIRQQTDEAVEPFLQAVESAA